MQSIIAKSPREHFETEALNRGSMEYRISLLRFPEVVSSVNFLRNHKDDIAAMDLFAVPTASLRLLYGFFVIEHGRRHILHFNATYNPSSAWVIQQLREAFPYDTAPRYFVFDRDAIFSPAVGGVHKGPWAQSLFAFLIAALGKTVPPSAGSETAAARCCSM